jgi:hypothetical protein
MCLADKIDSSDAGEKKKVRKILLRVRKKQSEILNKKSFKTIILIVIDINKSQIYGHDGRGMDCISSTETWTVERGEYSHLPPDH